jgi:hypothetical protein
VPLFGRGRATTSILNFAVPLIETAHEAMECCCADVLTKPRFDDAKY